MPKQTLELYDYAGPLAVAAIFASVLFLVSFFILNFFLVNKTDDFTAFERFGAKHNVRLGPHKLKQVKMNCKKKHYEYKPQDDAEEIEVTGDKQKQQIPIVKVEAASNC